MRLNNVHRVGDDHAGNINISDGKINAGDDNALNGLQLFFDIAIAFPGLINSHDHLDFNLFPQFGNRLYNNYVEWGDYIHREYKHGIAAGLSIPKALRVQWGVYKNLLCGVTTVVNHGDQLPLRNPIINVFEGCQSLHSVQLEKRWRSRLNYPQKKNIPVAIHIGEGTDQAAHDEIDKLIRWNLLGRKLVGIHGVAMDEVQAAHFAALAWCPQTNFYLLGKTAQVDRLKKHIPILFATDSTLTGDWNIWEHIRTARATGLLTDSELLDSLTANPAKVWQTHNGSLSPGSDADVVVARLKGDKADADNFFKLNPADILLVLHKGEIRLYDEMLYSQLPDLYKTNYSKIMISGTYKYVYGDMTALMHSIKQYQPDVKFPVESVIDLSIAS